jgi:perosamine synthetase
VSHAADALAATPATRPLRLRHVAPAGAPLRALDLARWAATMVGAGDPRTALNTAVGARFGVTSRAVCTGRAGMTLLLSALSRRADGRRGEVVLPSYTCYSVAASVMKAGLTPHLVDVDPVTLDFDLDALESAMHEGVLAIVATNLYGHPSDGVRIAAIARRHGAFFVDDAAQAMGATRDGEAAGTRGDVGLFSLDKGKNVSAIDGGLIVSRQPTVMAAIDDVVTGLPQPTGRHVATDAAKALAYFVLLRPWLYWLPASLPGLQLGATQFRMDFPLEGYSRTLAALAQQAFARLDAFTAARRSNAARLLSGLAGMPGLSVVPPIAGADPVYLRLPVLADTRERRDGWLRRLNAAAIGATGSYPACLADVPEVRARAIGADRPLAGGREIASRIMTLPTHPLVSSGDVARIVALLRGHP